MRVDDLVEEFQETEFVALPAKVQETSVRLDNINSPLVTEAKRLQNGINLYQN